MPGRVVVITGGGGGIGEATGRPREMAYPILFLACAESSFITGISLIVDAGKSIT